MERDVLGRESGIGKRTESNLAVQERNNLDEAMCSSNLCISVLFPEPVCAVGFGTFGLFSTLSRQSQEWNFTNYSMTSVSSYMDYII